MLLENTGVVAEVSVGRDATGSRLSGVWPFVVILAALVVWAWCWPYSGDGDSVLHYLAARGMTAHPGEALSAWGRPLHKLLLWGPAQAGPGAARVCQALVTSVLCWQTVGLAKRLGLRRPMLAAPLLLFQPFVFALASDTMTELPMALGLVVALRLWLGGRIAAACVVASLLPGLRPEGFFVVAALGVALLVRRGWRGLLVAPLLGAGMAIWVGACAVVLGDWLYVVHVWSWPMRSYSAYGGGPVYHYLLEWPKYCGPVLLVPFLCGVKPMWRNREARLPLVMWGLIIGVHTLLFWRAMFASAGLVRVLACSGPITALICLAGWDAIAARFDVRRAGTAAMVVGAAVWAITYYVLIGEHYRCFGYGALGDFARREHLLDEYLRRRTDPNDASAPMLIAGDKLFLAEMGQDGHPPKFAENRFNHEEQRELMASLPVGSVGAWDDQQAEEWFGVQIEELPRLGYSVLFERSQRVPDIFGWRAPRAVARHRYVLIRKDRDVTPRVGG